MANEQVQIFNASAPQKASTENLGPMQITIYLSDELIRKVDSLARKHGKSRSALIQEALSRDLEAKKTAPYPEETLSVFGAWNEQFQHRKRNSKALI